MSEDFDKVISPHEIQDFQRESVNTDIERRRNVYERFHSPELAERLNIERAKDYVENRTNEEITCDVYIIDVSHRKEILKEVVISYESAHSLYNADTHSVVLFISPDVPTVANEALLAHEFAHSVGQRVMYVDNKDRQHIIYGTKRIGIRLATHYGDFLEEAFASNIQTSYAAKHADHEYYQSLSERLGREITSPYDLDKLGHIEVRTSDEGTNTVIWPRYAFPKEGNSIIDENVLLAFTYDQLALKMAEHGYYNLDRLINNARKSPDSIKTLANAINKTFGKGSYSRLQKTPYVGDVDELIRTIDWIKRM